MNEDITLTANFENITAISEGENIFHIELWSNPVRGELSIHLALSSTEDASAKFYSLNGTLVHATKIYSGYGVINKNKISKGSAGIYILKIETKNGVSMKRLVIF